MRVWVKSDVGLSRQVNQDAWCHRTFVSPEDVHLCGVADGMGGYRAGEVASRLALEAVAEEIGRALKAGQPLEEALREAMEAANYAIVRQSLADPECLGMGTTVTVALVSGGTLLIGHVGDSRAYVLRGGRLRQITRDHSLVAELVRNGDLTEEQAQAHPQRNILTQAFGSDLRVKPDISSVPLESGDILMLCTDGLSGTVPSALLEETLVKAEDLEQACRDLVALANQRGGHDNITVLLAGPIAVEGVPPGGAGGAGANAVGGAGADAAGGAGG